MFQIQMLATFNIAICDMKMNPRSLGNEDMGRLDSMAALTWPRIDRILAHTSHSRCFT